MITTKTITQTIMGTIVFVRNGVIGRTILLIQLVFGIDILLLFTALLFLRIGVPPVDTELVEDKKRLGDLLPAFGVVV